VVTLRLELLSLDTHRSEVSGVNTETPMSIPSKKQTGCDDPLSYFSYFGLSHVFLLPVKQISEQPYSNGEPISHTVLWEEIRTTHFNNYFFRKYVKFSYFFCKNLN
jgi:hypothetical protein